MTKVISLQCNSYYHISNCGDTSDPIFIEEHNYRYFLELYPKYIQPIADTYAYCLLKDHLHLLVRIKTEAEQQAWHAKTRQPFPLSARCNDVHSTDQTAESNQPPELRSPGQQFLNLFRAYATAVDKAYKRSGYLFEGCYKHVEVTDDDQLAQLVLYIHRNPQKHDLVEDFRTWPYSSYNTLLSSRPTRLKRREVLAWFDGVHDFEISHQCGIDETLLAPLALEEL